MIQRIQSVYLLLVAVVLLLAAWLPTGWFILPDGAESAFKPLGVTADADFPTWGMFGLLILAAVVALCTIFLFRNRILQIRLTVFGGLLLIAYYLLFLVFYFWLSGRLEGATFRIGWALCLPLVGIVLDYLAIRAIYRDEVLVRDSNRLRSR